MNRKESNWRKGGSTRTVRTAPLISDPGAERASAQGSAGASSRGLGTTAPRAQLLPSAGRRRLRRPRWALNTGRALQFVKQLFMLFPDENYTTILQLGYTELYVGKEKTQEKNLNIWESGSDRGLLICL